MAYKFLFAVSNRVNLSNAQAVMRHLNDEDTAFLRIYDGKVVREQPEFGSHVATPGIKRIFRLSRLPHFNPSTILIVPQDFGLLPRVLIARAHKQGSLVVVLPDGVLSSNPIQNHHKLRFLAQRVLSLTLTSCKITAPANGFLGGSLPDLILRWGPAWAASIRSDENTKVVDTGCPRFDELLLLDPPVATSRRLLVCSQPMHIPSWTAPYAAEWYGFLSELSQISEPGLEIRIRLHPAELTENLPGPLNAYKANPRNLLEDLEWATVVASPFSTVLLEAAAAKRRAISLVRDQDMQAMVDAIPFFASDSVSKVGWDSSQLLAQVSVNTAGGDLSPFLANLGESASLAAQEIRNLSRPQKKDS